MRNFLNSLFFFCLFCFPLKGQINLQDGIVAAFPINEGTVIDESGSNNDCNLPDGVTLIENRIGIPNSALMFDGNSYLECGPPNALDDLSIPVSLSFWYKVTEGDIGDFLPILFTDDNNGNSGNYYGFFFIFPKCTLGETATCLLFAKKKKFFYFFM